MNEFLQTPIPDFGKITKEHLEYFIEMELAVTTAYTVLSCIYFFCWNFAAQNQGGKLRRAFFLSLLHKDQTWFDLQKNFEDLNRTLENTRQIEDGIGEEIPVAISLSVMCSLCCALALAHGLFLARMRTVIMYQSQKKEQLLYRREMTRNNKTVYKAILLQSLAISTMYTLNFGVWAMIFWYGTANVLHNHGNCSDKLTFVEYDAGDLFVIIMSVIFGCGNVYLVRNVMKAVQVAKLCNAKVLKVIDGSSGIDGLSVEGFIPTAPFRGRVEFMDVRFTYPGKHEDITLNHLNFTAESNSLIALVGLQGSGKSTVLKLISKEYLPDSGFIIIDDLDIKALNVNWLRSRIGYVPQELTLFDMTIEDNIRMGNLEATFIEIQVACMNTGAHDFIMSFKGVKFHNAPKNRNLVVIGHRGCLLTPCQQQLICIARALVREPKILLLDEPTFPLDSKATSEFMQCLKSISTNRTVILVAHRLSTTIHADQIYVMKKGRVIEKGTHKRLLKAQGPYVNLCTMNRPSQSIHLPGYLEVFDSSEMSVVSLVRTFNVKPTLPNLYNDMLSLNPVVSKVTYAILKHATHTTQGYHDELEWKLEEEDPALVTYKDDFEDLFGVHLISSENQLGIKPSKTNVLSPSIASKEEINIQSKVGKQTVKREGEYERLSALNNFGLNWLSILTMASSNPLLIVIGSICSVLLAVPMPAFGLLFALVLDIVTDATLAPTSWSEAKTLGDDEHTYARWTIAFIAIVAVYMGFFSFIQDLTLNVSAFQAVQTIRRIIYSSIMKQDMSFFEDTRDSSPRLASVLLQDADGIRHLTICVYGTLIQTIFIFICAVTFCIYCHIRQTFYIILIATLIVAVNLADGWLARKQYGRTIKVLQDMSSIILEVFRSKHVITVCQMEPHFAQVFTNIQRKSLRVKKSLSCIRIFTFGVGQSAVFWGLGVILEVNKVEIMKDRKGFMNAMAVGFVLIFGLATLGTNLSVLMGFKHVAKGAKRILKVINRKTQLDPPENQISVTDDECSKAIEFVHTEFCRPHIPERCLLKGVNLVIPPKRVTAIVGTPESGKDGFLDILGRFYDAAAGLVAINGNDLRFFTASSLRERISVVTKDPQIFSRTVAQNIAIGDNSRPITMDDIIAVAKEANVHNFIVSLPEGYETRIGGEQDYLSGGQKYKIAIARALLKKPKILIIDDLTTILDKEGESSVLESVSHVKNDRTVIVISHRIDPIRDADRIAVMENGYLEEVGTHRGLLSRRPDGIYAHMWKSQHPMEDEKFVKGTVSFSKKMVDQRIIPLPPPTDDRGTNGDDENDVDTKIQELTENMKQQIYDDEEDDSPTSGCWGGFLGAIGLRIVESESTDLLD
ncbi:Bile salt export pump [Orchesella cincta]|uniref:Bile salt export pump n=1 Tax=Orchesella cincta TaxID=48709 RepID=A0A1D2NCT9_ORCCI|nr:Bile salt export pump [Orchesella cincta]